ncbi:hypothetical protein [Streptomyces sp. NPDC050121]|uniref:hypothetical protein n=1 Tax=Streptomyces sp. NPDC050121 TaxID=3365601 RepID=UPI00379562A4
MGDGDIYTELGNLDGQAMTWHNVAMALSGMRRYDDALEAKQHSLRGYSDLGDVRQTAGSRAR